MRLTVLANGEVKWHGLTKEEVEAREIEVFKDRYAEANPPPETSFPVKIDAAMGIEQDNRWRCIGGPLNNEGLAKVLKVKKGRGKSAIEILVPINPEQFTYTTNGITTTYKFSEGKYESN